MNNNYNKRPPYNQQNQRPNAPNQGPQRQMPPQQSQLPHTNRQRYGTAPQKNGQYQYQQRPQVRSSSYPPVRHKSRQQSKRAAGFVVFMAAILVLLLVSVIIFAARCASGDIGAAADFTTPNVTTEIPSVSTAPTDTTEPIVTAPPETQLDPKYEYSIKSEADVHRGYLLLINGDNEYNFDGGFTLQDFMGNKSSSYKLSGSFHKFDKYAMSWCDKMMDAMAAYMGTGDVLVNSSFRTEQDQEDIYNYYLAEKGEEYVKQYVGLPGYSEHHTGLAVDFTIYTDNGEAYTFDDKPEYPEWLNANGYKYGFIQRYPADKTEITGIAYESWHYRFVGKPHAYYMYKSNLCFEEYIELLRGFEFGDKHLAITDDEGNSWEIYFVPADPSGSTKVPVPKYVEYEISGNNADGFIVTCHM